MSAWNRTWPWFALVVGFLSLSPLSAQQAEPTEEYYRPTIDLNTIEYRTDWYGVYLKDRKVGYMRGDRTRLENGNIRESDLLSIKLVSFGQKTEMKMDQSTEFEGKAPYSLLKASSTMSNGPLKQTVTVRKLDKGYEFIHEAPGVRQVKNDEKLVYDLGDAMSLELWIQKGPKVGSIIRGRHLEISDQKIDVLTSTILSSNTSLVKGIDVRFFELETISKEKGIKALSRHDSTGLMLSDTVAIFELRLETEANAKDTEYSQDLFVMGMAKINKGIGDARAITELVVEIEGKTDLKLETGPRQSLSSDDTKGAKLLKLGKAHGKNVKATEAEIAEALQETPAYAISHPKVKELALKAIGDAKTSEDKVKRLVNFVHGYVQPSLSADVPHIDLLIKNKKGDCKSYALLLTNLARASGIPSREVAGLLYVGDDMKAFGGHAWNEVVLDGVWVPVDAAFNETEVNATHISFGTESRASANLLNSIGKISFRLVDVKRSK